MKAFDVTRPISTGVTVWPGDDGVVLERTASISEGSIVNVSRMQMGVHTGTHVDAPLHFIDGGKSIDRLDIHLFTGWVRVVDVQQVKSIGAECVHQLTGLKGEAVFFKTMYSEKTLEEAFDTGFTGLMLEAARILVDEGIRVIGTDALSIEEYSSRDFPVHRFLLQQEILIVEGLCLKDVAPGRYRYICMPLLMKGADGSPARVILIDE